LQNSLSDIVIPEPGPLRMIPGTFSCRAHCR